MVGRTTFFGLLNAVSQDPEYRHLSALGVPAVFISCGAALNLESTIVTFRDDVDNFGSILFCRYESHRVVLVLLLAWQSTFLVETLLGHRSSRTTLSGF